MQTSEIQQRILNLQERLIEGNRELLALCQQLKPDDQREFLPKIEEMIINQQNKDHAKKGIKQPAN